MTEPTPAVQRLAEAQFVAYQSEYSADHLSFDDFYTTARADLAIGLRDLGEMAQAMNNADASEGKTPLAFGDYIVYAHHIREALLGED